MLAFIEVSNAALKKLSDDQKEEACFSSYFEAGLQELVDKMGQDTLTTVQRMAAMDRCCACLQTIVGKRDQAMVTKVRHPTAEKVTGPLFNHTSFEGECPQAFLGGIKQIWRAANMLQTGPAPAGSLVQALARGAS